MLSGKTFRLDTPTLAIDSANGARVAVPIPSGTIIKVVAGPRNGDRMVDVLVKDQLLTMFAIDVTERGTEIIDLAAGA